MSRRTGRADFVPMSNETRGKALYDRMVAMGMDESKLSRATGKDRGTIRRVFSGTASNITYDQLEQWFKREEAKNTAEAPSGVAPVGRPPFVIRIEEGGTVVVEGPVENMDEITEAARSLMRDLKRGPKPGASTD